MKFAKFVFPRVVVVGGGVPLESYLGRGCTWDGQASSSGAMSILLTMDLLQVYGTAYGSGMELPIHTIQGTILHPI